MTFGEWPVRKRDVYPPELRYEIRLAFTRRDILLDLMGTNFPPARLPRVPAMQADPERAAGASRDHLGITIADQREWRSPDVALRRCREALERIGVLVFQTTRIDVGEMRGFSIWNERLPVVLINGADAPSGRCFSPLHELCHLILRDGGLCLPDEEAGADHHEVICNRIARAARAPPPRRQEREPYGHAVVIVVRSVDRNAPNGSALGRGRRISNFLLPLELLASRYNL